ncbi:MAG: gamma-glutamyl-gamma-aminobutyrate hydrolase family protein [Candidatus Limnocylindria bacterium]
MKPRILLTRGRRPAGPYAAYVARIREAGAEPIEVIGPEDIPPAFDGICLTGGPDVDPVRYGQERNGADEPDLHRDKLELDEVLPRAAGRPILAICRGMQVLNIHRNGTLIQDIGQAHKATGDAVILLPARIAPSSRLAAISGTDPVVNHRHHQVVDKIGEGLRPTAWADGYVEAFESTDGSWLLGVQWHPERVADGLSPNVVGIFGAFVEAARSWATEP